jgi:hypothetical protein
VFDLDCNNNLAYSLQECFGITAYENGAIVPQSSPDCTLESFEEYNATTNRFRNKVGLEPNNYKVGDVNFILTNEVDSVCIVFEVDANNNL